MRRRKRADLPLHVTYQNAKDGVSLDQRNCTFGQCDLARSHGMDFFVNPDPLDPEIWAEWTSVEDGKRLHHRASVRRRRPDDSETMHEAIVLVAATDKDKRAMLKKFPKQGVGFVLTGHTVKAVERSSHALKPGETETQAAARRAAARERRLDLARLRRDGQEPPPKTRNRRVRARFGSKD